MKPKRPSLMFLKVLAIIKAVPRGKVASYGQIARLAGHEGAARHVSWILHSSSKKYNLPWHRIISVSGKISLPLHMGYFGQRQRLISEKVEFNEQNCVEFNTFGWNPHKSSTNKILKKARQLHLNWGGKSSDI